MVENKWFTPEQLKERWGVSDETITDFVQSGELPFYCHYDDGTRGRRRVEKKDLEWIDDDGEKQYLDYFYDFESPVFLYDDIIEVEKKDQCRPTINELSCNAMLEQKVFKQTMLALGDVLSHCEASGPAKRDDIYDIVIKHGLTKRVFESIWKALPFPMRRKAGDRDR